MKRVTRILALAAVMVAPAAAHAQACSPAQVAANPLASMGYQAFVRINNTAFNLSCYYATLSPGVVGFASSPSVFAGSGTAEIRATINQLSFLTVGDPSLNYGVASTVGRSSASTSDFVFAFAAPLTNTRYDGADAQIGITRASGNPSVTRVTAGAPSTVALGGAPAYLVAHSNFVAVSGGGSNANPFATNLGVDVGGSSCTTGTACSYPTASNNPNAVISAWGTVISYRQSHTATRASNAQVNGQVDITVATPEPATTVLMASGLLALGGVGYVRRRRA